MSKVHEIKEWPNTFSELIAGTRNIEIRFNDREYEAGDVLKIREWDPMANEYTGRECVRRVERKHESPRLMPGYVVMEVSPVDCRWEITDRGEKVLAVEVTEAQALPARAIVCAECGAELDADPGMRHLCTVPEMADRGARA